MNGIEKFIDALRQAGLVSQDAEAKLTGEDIAEMLWLLQYVHQKQGFQAVEPVPRDEPLVRPEQSSPSFSQNEDEKAVVPPSSEKEKKPEPEKDTTRHIYLPSQRLVEQGGQGGFLFRSPAASALPQSLDIARALRPLMRRIPSRTNFLLDEPATVQRIAEAQKSVWAPVLKPAPTRWLEIALVVDVGDSMIPWRQTIDELRILLENHGAFRDVRTWRLTTDEGEHAALYLGTDVDTQQERDPKELIDPGGRRLILVVSDAVSAAWHSGKMQKLLDLWGQNNIVTLVQVFPKRLWSRTALGFADIVDVHAPDLKRGNAGLLMREEPMQLDEEMEVKPLLPVPIITLEPPVLANWAKMIAGAENIWTLGAVFYQNLPELPEEAPFAQTRPTSQRDLVRQFRATASSTASRLLNLLSAAPISFPVIRLVQQALLPQANQLHIAEIFLSGLLKEIFRDETTKNPDAVEYDFLPGVREILQESIPIPSEFEVIEAVSAYLGSRYGTLRDFYALAKLPAPNSSNKLYIGAESRPFARIVASAWRHIGGMYDAMAESLERYVEMEMEQDVYADNLETNPLVQSRGEKEDRENPKKLEDVFERHFGEVDSVLELWKSQQERDSKREKTSFELVAEQLELTGWVIEDFNKMDLSRAQGIAIRHDPSFPDDYILYIDQGAVGVVKVRPMGEPLAGIEEPISLQKAISKPKRRVRSDTLIMTMFVYESTSVETRFTSYIELEPRSRSVFTFHRPETLALWISQAPPDVPAEQNNLLRSKLRRMPSLSQDGLRKHQYEAIRELERSLANDHKHTLLQMIMNTGMTYTALHSIHRLLKYGGARRILYVFEYAEAVNYVRNILERIVLTDDGKIERFSNLYRIHNLRDGTLDHHAHICIGTFADLNTIYCSRELSSTTLVQMDYNPALSIEYFDLIFIGNCTDSAYRRWRPLIEYFDAFIVGIGHKADDRLRGMFDRNLVYEQKRPLPRALVLTASQTEYKAAQQHPDLEVTGWLTDTPFEQGTFPTDSGLWEVMIAKVDPEAVGVTAGIAQAIDEFNPLVILSVGIADGIRDVQPGDVVVATKVYEYQFDPTSTTSDRIHMSRRRTILQEKSMMQEARRASKSDGWLKRLRRHSTSSLPQIYFAPIVAGNKVARDDAYSFAQTIYDDAVALDSASFLDSLVGSHTFLTATLTPIFGQDILIIRGISSSDNKRGIREVAAQNAAAFAFEMLAHLNPTEFLRDSSQDVKVETQEIDGGELFDDEFVDDEAERAYQGLVAISHAEFEDFLLAQENEYWLVYKRSLEEDIHEYPVSVSGLMDAIKMNDDGGGLVYVFWNGASAEEVLKATNWNEVPEITERDLYDYIIRSSGGGKDFLWFDCNLAEASNGEPAILLRYDDRENNTITLA